MLPNKENAQENSVNKWYLLEMAMMDWRALRIASIRCGVCDGFCAPMKPLERMGA